MGSGKARYIVESQDISSCAGLRTGDILKPTILAAFYSDPHKSLSLFWEEEFSPHQL